MKVLQNMAEGFLWGAAGALVADHAMIKASPMLSNRTRNVAACALAAIAVFYTRRSDTTTEGIAARVLGGCASTIVLIALSKVDLRILR